MKAVHILIALSFALPSLADQAQEVPVDNFTPTNSTFQLPYIFDDQYDTDGNGPLIVFLGLDFNNDIFDDNYNLTETFQKTEWVHQVLAKNLNASYLYVGRRYQDVQCAMEKTAESMQYLTTEQLLMDFALVIDHFLYESEIYGWKDKKIILMGGGFGGELALYFKIKYPHLGDIAVVSNSKILRNQLGMDTISKQITQLYNLTDNCNNNVRDIFQTLDKFIDFPEYWNVISLVFKLCDLIKTKEDIEQLKYKIAQAYIYQSEYNYPYEVENFPANALNTSCELLETFDRSNWNNWHLFKYNQQAMVVAQNYTGNMKCFNITNESTGKGDISSEDYLKCTEYYSPWELTGTTDMFYKVDWQHDDYLSYCKEKYSVNVDETYQTLSFGVSKDYAATLSKMAISKVIFSNGALNPSLGQTVRSSTDPNIVVYEIEETPKFWEFQLENDKDPDTLKNARTNIEKTIKGWL